MRGLGPNEDSIESFTLPTTENPFIDQVWLAEEKRRLCKTSGGEDIYKARYLAQPVISKYMVFPTFTIKEHISTERATFNPDYPVYVAIDPGGVYAVAAIQLIPQEGFGNTFGNLSCCIIDEVYFRTTVTTGDVIDECRKREWWKNTADSTQWDKDYSGSIDVAAVEQRAVWQRETGFRLRARKVPIMAGIDTLQHWIVTNTLVLNPLCYNGMDEFARYSYPEENVSNMGKRDIRRNKPKDEFNHLIKAVTYFLVNHFGYYARRKTRSIKQRRSMW